VTKADGGNDLVERYQKPSFGKHQQPWPGLARDTRSRPDHGETSYTNSGRPSETSYSTVQVFRAVGGAGSL
jgi:hypothetical protein